MTGPAIVAEGLTRRFGRFTAVDHVSFHVERGEIFGFLGANGAGKSTTIRMLCGLLAPTEGDALVAGVRVRRAPEAVKWRIGYMSQRFSLYPDLDTDANLEFFGGAYGLWGRALRRRMDELVELVGLGEVRRVPTGELPGGLRQRVALANALLHDPEIVFLDEPTAGVDPAARRRFWRIIRGLAAKGRTVFVTTHYMDEAEYCRRIGLMASGRLAALGTPEELKRRAVPGRLFAVEGVAAEAARAVAGVVEVQPFGAGLHVRAEGGLDADVLAAALPAGARIEEIEPTLEDVFLRVVGGEAP